MVNILIIAVLIVLIYVFFKVKNTQHKTFSVILIILVIFFYVSASKILAEHDVKINSFDGMVTASKLYLNWLGQVFINSKALVGNAIKLEWGANSTIPQ